MWITRTRAWNLLWFGLSPIANCSSHEPLRTIASLLVSHSVDHSSKIPSHGPFYYLTSLLRCWDGRTCVLSGVSTGKTALWPGKEFAVILKCIFVCAPLMGVDKQHICADFFAPTPCCESHPFSCFAWCLLFIGSLRCFSRVLMWYAFISMVFYHLKTSNACQCSDTSFYMQITEEISNVIVSKQARWIQMNRSV